jgi:hypothetical protein
LRREDDDDYDSGGDDDDMGGMATYYDRTVIGEDAVGTLIRVYRATLKRCLRFRDNDVVDDGGGGGDSTAADYLLLGPIAHLIGLVCAAGVSVRDLRSLLVLAGDSPTYTEEKEENNHPNDTGGHRRRPILDLSRLHVLRALRYAAEYSVRSNGVIDRPGPQTFFSFGGDGGRSSGLSATFKPWPFRYDFGMACWFRAESFTPVSRPKGDVVEDGQHVVLFRATTPSGARIEVLLESHSVDTAGVHAALVVTVADADTSSNGDCKAMKAPRKVRLVGCVLSPLIWYHVSVRLTRARLGRFSLTSKDDLSIFLNGKLMLKEHMKLPQFFDSKGGGKGIVGFGSLSSAETPKGPTKITFFSNFDGQAGALYLFKDQVSDETIRALYLETSATTEQNNLSHFGSFVDQWDAKHGKLNNLTKAYSSASMNSELEDIILPNYSIFTGEYGYRSPKVFFDVAKDDDIDSDHIPSGLSNSSFGSKLLIVWDPCRVENGVLTEPLLGAHVTLKGQASTWSFESVRDTIESLGGMSQILLLFGMLANSVQQRHGVLLTGIMDDYSNMLVSGLIFLVSSFIREHEFNSCELYRCGGINVIEKLLHDCKKKDIDEGAPYRIGVSPIVAKYSASAILDLWQASRSNFALESTVFSRLLVNVPLFLGGVATSQGVSFHAVMLPILSELTMTNPDKVRDCIDIREIFQVVNEYSCGVAEVRCRRSSTCTAFVSYRKEVKYFCFHDIDFKRNGGKPRHCIL